MTTAEAKAITGLQGPPTIRAVAQRDNLGGFSLLDQGWQVAHLRPKVGFVHVVIGQVVTTVLTEPVGEANRFAAFRAHKNTLHAIVRYNCSLRRHSYLF